MFGRNKAIALKIDELLDKVSQSALVVVAAVSETLDADPSTSNEKTTRHVEQILELKRKCSALRREIEAELYTEMLIPDLVGDVANLIEELHRLVEDMHYAMRFNYYSRLELPEFVRADAKELAKAAGQAVEQLVLAARAFFRDFTHVRDYVHKVAFYESESDAVRDRILEKIYQTDLGLAEKDHIARSVRELDGISDAAERIADVLTIYSIKRAE